MPAWDASRQNNTKNAPNTTRLNTSLAQKFNFFLVSIDFFVSAVSPFNVDIFTSV